MSPLVADVAAPPGGAPPGAMNAAFELAAWTKLSPEVAQILYDGLVEQHPGLISSKAAIARLAEFASIADVSRRLIYALCQSALEAGALPAFCRLIVGREAAALERPEAELEDIRTRIGAPGTAHSIVDRARGLIPTRMFGVMDRRAQAIGFVEIANGEIREIIGTAILIRRDVVITCAHVAFRQLVQSKGIVTDPPTLPITRICFPETPVGPQEAMLLNDPVLTHSNAHMIGPNQLDRQVTARALKRLDFALLRLDRAIDRVEPISIEGRDLNANGHLSFLIGFPAVNQAFFDASPIVRDESAGGRLIHMINSVPGMSGGCVIADNGVPIGLHEGSIPMLDPQGKPVAPVDGKPQVENRAVLLSAISQHLSTLQPNPLAALDQPPGVVMLEQALVTRLVKRSAQLLADPALQPSLDTLTKAVTAKMDPDKPWVAHPWFTDRDRARIEKWFATAATSIDTKSRVAFINGPHGSGKTFMIDVLKRIITDPGSDMLRVTWSEGDTTVATLGRQLAAKLDLTGTRTAEGHARYETVPELVAGLERYGLPAGATGARPRRLFVALDTGDGSGSVTEPDTWIDLVGALAQQPWARIVLCGLPEDLIRRVEDAVPPDVECTPFEIKHVRSRDIATFLESVRMPAGSGATPQETAATFDGPKMLHQGHPDVTTALAALCAIGWHRGQSAAGTGVEP